MPAVPSPALRRQRLGAALRRLREAAGLTGDQVVARVGWASASKLSRLENGRSRPNLGDVLDLLDLYGVDPPIRDELVAIARGAANNRAWLRSYPVMTPHHRRYAEMEAGCAQIREYASAVVPALLQTPEYARVRLASTPPLPPARRRDGRQSDDPGTEIAALLARQSVLTRGPGAPRYEAVLEESALSCRTAPPHVMAAQLQHLTQVARRRNVTLRVLPASAALPHWHVPQTSFALYRPADPQDPTAVAVEVLGADVIRTDEAVVRGYGRIFDWLWAAARPPRESLEWMAAAAAHAATSAPSSTPLDPHATDPPPGGPPGQRRAHEPPRVRPNA